MKIDYLDTAKYAICSIKWKDTGEIEDGYIFKLSLDLESEEEDERIFFYCDGIESLDSLTKEDNGEDFVILNVQCINEL